jgi:hypothetical protein
LRCPGTMNPHLSCLEIIGGSSPTRQVPKNGLHDIAEDCKQNTEDAQKKFLKALGST